MTRRQDEGEEKPLTGIQETQNTARCSEQTLEISRPSRPWARQCMDFIHRDPSEHCTCMHGYKRVGMDQKNMTYNKAD